MISLACAKCGVLAYLRRADDTFRCARCGSEQPSLRHEVGSRPASVHARTHQGAAYDELVPFAKTFGLRERCAAITVDCDGIEIEISLGLNSGSVTGLDLLARTPKGFPSITLQRETSTEVEAKRRGITHEAQTGDAVFDAAVFIASDAADDDVLPVLAAPAVRAAALQLLRDCERITFGASSVFVHVPLDTDGVFDPDRVLARLQLVRVLAGAPRPIAPRPETTDVWGITAAVGMSVGIFIGPIAAAGVASLCRPVDGYPTKIAIGVGLVLALAAQPLIKRKIRGRSDSHKMLVVGRVAAALLLPELAVMLLLGANALFDPSSERTHELVIDAVSYDSENDTTTASASASTRTGAAAALGAQEIAFADPDRSVQRGQRVVLKTKRGALGWAWRSSAAKVHVGQHVLVEK